MTTVAERSTMVCGGLSTTTPQAVGGCGAALTRETRQRLTRFAGTTMLSTGESARVRDICFFCPSCAAKHEAAVQVEVTSWAREATPMRGPFVPLSTCELEIIQRALGGPYEPSTFFNSGLSSAEALQIKIDAELARRKEK